MTITKIKYNSKKTIVDGIKFDSMSEANFYLKIKGYNRYEILELQPKVYLTDARILYKPDFFILDKHTQEKFYVDVKGFMTPVFALKARLWRHFADLPLRIYTAKKNYYELTNLFLPDRKNSKIKFDKNVI